MGFCGYPGAMLALPWSKVFFKATAAGWRPRGPFWPSLEDRTADELLDLPGVRVYGRRELESSLSTKSALASTFSFGKRVTL
jgi:hypothetical protein